MCVVVCVCECVCDCVCVSGGYIVADIWNFPPFFLYFFSLSFFLSKQRVPGVVATSVGYCQGALEHPSYELVCTGATGVCMCVYLCVKVL